MQLSFNTARSSQQADASMSLMGIFFLIATLVAAGSGAAAGSGIEPKVERVDPNHVIVTWTASTPVDVYLSDRPDSDTKKAKLVSRSDRDGRYEATVTDRRRSYFLLRDAIDGKVIRVSERALPLECGSNFRDIGGYAAADGKHVRWGSIYRSGATPLLSKHDLSYIRTLGLSSMVDLRTTEERQLAPSRLTELGIRYIAIDYPFNTLFPKAPTGADATASPAARDGYRRFLTMLAPQYRAIFVEMLSHKGPIVYNCTAGHDRTGIATALILSALGVPLETIFQDYHLSTKYRRPEYEMPPIDPADFPGNLAVSHSISARLAKPGPPPGSTDRPFLADTFDEIDSRWGSVENYLEQVLGIDSAHLATLRVNYLE